MRRTPSREIMVFSISFLDVIASALGAILILFIIQYKKTINARVEVVRSEKRHVQCSEVLEYVFATELKDNRVTGDTVYVVEKSKDKDHEIKTEHDKSGTSTLQDQLVNVARTKVRVRVRDPKPQLKPHQRAAMSLDKKQPTLKTPERVAMAPDMAAMAPMVATPMATPALRPIAVAGVTPDGMQAMSIEAPARARIPPREVMAPGKRPAHPGEAVRPGPQPRPQFRLPPKPKRKALATCVT
ncbi:MAG: hypothetical protein ABI333_02685, partial [bacterium]